MFMFHKDKKFETIRIIFFKMLSQAFLLNSQAFTSSEGLTKKQVCIVNKIVLNFFLLWLFL